MIDAAILAKEAEGDPQGLNFPTHPPCRLSLQGVVRCLSVPDVGVITHALESR